MQKRIIVFLFCFLTCASLILNAQTNFTRYVDPFIGTGGHGHTYPGASLPFGMVQLSPDNDIKGWDWCSGYHNSDNSIMGFSHTHLSGTGCADYGDILIMPTTGELKIIPGDKAKPGSGYRSQFKHENEFASPGYYSVILDDYNINVELTASKRTGFHRYTFPRSENSNIIIDLNHGIEDRTKDAVLKVIGSNEVEGFRRSTGWANDHTIYFVARFSKDFKSFGTVIDNQIVLNKREAKGKNVKAFFQYSVLGKEIILVKVGISAVSIEGARKNLYSEISGWDFDKVRNDADKIWNESLSKIKIEGGSEAQKKTFYTALYHCLLSPNLFNDIDKKYMGMDKKIHSADKFEIYTVFSLWDTFRALHPLFTIIEPERTVDLIKTLLSKYDESGLLPVWELAANETNCMIGYHSVPVIVDAFIKGIKSFNIEKAYIAMKKSAEQDRLGLKSYKQMGYIPSDAEGESVSKTLEYAYDDWCIAQMAKSLNKNDDFQKYSERAQFYKNIYDQSTGFMRAKKNGHWITPFDPKVVSGEYTEANAYQYNLFVPHDLHEFERFIGGREKFIQKIDEVFNTLSELKGKEQIDISGMIGQYAHGNEPSHHMAYLYNYAGAPWKTQERVREIMDVMYTDKIDGLCGNEDCGQMSAWYIFSAMGFYPVCPGQDIYVFGSPIFDRISIELTGGKKFIIQSKNVSKENKFIQSSILNGRIYKKSYLKHSDITQGGELIFEMGPKPDFNWGNSDDAIPPSVSSGIKLIPVPYIKNSSTIFTDTLSFTLECSTPEAKIYFTLDDTEPNKNSTVYSGSLNLTKSTILKAFISKEGEGKSLTMTTNFIKIPSGRGIKYLNPYSSQYTAGGDFGLIDLVRGTDNFHDNRWQGFEGIDLDVIIDLGKLSTISKITSSFLQDIRSWIFLPESVEYLISVDGKEFKTIENIKNIVPNDREGSMVKEFSSSFTKAFGRYIHVKAKNIGTCPEWHIGSGSKAWIFVDEIVIE